MANKIEFVYSWIYDEIRRESLFIQNKLKQAGETYPSSKEVKKKLAFYEKRWHQEENEVLRELSNLMGLPWKRERIKCYVVGYGRSISDPLTVSLSNKGNQFIDTLTHELIHQLQTQNYKKMRKWWSYIQATYGTEPITTRNHILLHAVHTRLLKKRYSKQRLIRNIRKSDNSPDYKRSWEIVSSEGEDAIIETFRKLTR